MTLLQPRRRRHNFILFMLCNFFLHFNHFITKLSSSPCLQDTVKLKKNYNLVASVQWNFKAPRNIDLFSALKLFVMSQIVYFCSKNWFYAIFFILTIIFHKMYGPVNHMLMRNHIFQVFFFFVLFVLHSNVFQTCLNRKILS